MSSYEASEPEANDKLPDHDCGPDGSPGAVLSVTGGAAGAHIAWVVKHGEHLVMRGPDGEDMIL